MPLIALLAPLPLSCHAKTRLNLPAARDPLRFQRRFPASFFAACASDLLFSPICMLKRAPGFPIRALLAVVSRRRLPAENP